MLRFSRLFKPVYAPHIWKKKKKKKPDGEEETEKEKQDKKTETKAQETGPDDGGVGTDCSTRGEAAEEEVYEEYCPIKLDPGYIPKPEEIAPDETVSTSGVCRSTCVKCNKTTTKFVRQFSIIVRICDVTATASNLRCTRRYKNK